MLSLKAPSALYQHRRQCLVRHLLLMCKNSYKSDVFPLQVQHYTNFWQNIDKWYCTYVRIWICEQIDIYTSKLRMLWDVINICFEVHFMSLPSHSPKSKVSTVASCPSGSSSHILQWCGVWWFVLAALDATAELRWFVEVFSPGGNLSCIPSVLHPIAAQRFLDIVPAPTRNNLGQIPRLCWL